MNCGEFEKRNKEFSKIFDSQKYFSNLVLEDVKTDLDEKELIIFDVGAHKGESAIFFNNLFPSARIYSFEPSPDSVAYIKLLNLNNVSIFPIALSDFVGVADFNIQDISHLSSLIPINSESISSISYAKTESHSVVSVEVNRGDEFVKQYKIPRINLLKIDVQANELKTLQGFSGVIESIRCVFVEVSIYDLYNRKSKIADIESALPGFELYDIYEVSKNPKTLGTDWATFVYINAS